MTSYQSRGNQYYVCRVHRQRGACENTRFHRIDHIEGVVEDFVCMLLRDPDTFRKRVEEQAEIMRRSLRSGESIARALRKELDTLDDRENNIVDAIASLGLENTRVREKFRDELDRIQVEREDVQARLEEVSDTEEQVRRLREIPRMVDEYLADLPHLLDPDATIREYETVPEERTEDNPLGAYRLTPKRMRHKDEDQLETERQANLEARRERFREIYTALGIGVVVNKDRSLEIRWSGGCSRWHRGTSVCCTA